MNSIKIKRPKVFLWKTIKPLFKRPLGRLRLFLPKALVYLFRFSQKESLGEAIRGFKEKVESSQEYKAVNKTHKV